MTQANILIRVRLYTFLTLAFLCSACSPQQQEKTALTLPKFVEDTSLCDFSHVACNKEVAGINLSLLIIPFHTPSEKPLTIKLASSEAIRHVKMRIEGRDMFMGIIPVKLSQLNEKQYSGQLIFGSCSSNYMVWRVFVSFKQNDELHVATFDFLADSNTK